MKTSRKNNSSAMRIYSHVLSVLFAFGTFAAPVAIVQSHEQKDLLYSDPIGYHIQDRHVQNAVDEQRRLRWQELSCSHSRPAPSPEAYSAAGDRMIGLGDSPISVVGATISRASWRCNCNATIYLPSGTIDGDLLILFVAGSDGISGAWLDSADTGRLGRLLKDGWTPIEKAGSTDLNIIALWKVYHATTSSEEGESLQEFRIHSQSEENDTSFADSNARKTTTAADVALKYTSSVTVISHGVSNTWLSLVALRGTRTERPIRASRYLKTKSAKTCKNGEAKAPSVRMSARGVVLAAFTYDDPHQGTIISPDPDRFHLLSSFASGDDGMTVGISAMRQENMMSGEIDAIGKSKLSGGGQAIGMSMSIRAS